MSFTYALVGDPVDSSLSPSMHNAALRELGMDDYSYIVYRVRKGELGAGIESLMATVGLAGLNVTIPHKVDVLEYLDEEDESCRLVGAANTVSVTDAGKLRGHNTDRDGFMSPIWRRNLTAAGSRVLLIGAGGAARAIVSAFATEAAVEVVIANRSRGRAEELAAFADKAGIGATVVGLDEAGREAPACKFIVNASPIGTAGEESPVPAEAIPSDSVVYDVVYRPMATDLAAKAKRRGATVIYGYEMLLWQACLSFEIWHGMKAPYEAMRRAILGPGAPEPGQPGAGGR